MQKEEQVKLTEEIIETAYRLLTHKLAFGGLTARNESAFQLEFGHILKTLGQLYEFRLDDKFHLEFETYIQLKEKSDKSGTEWARVDVLLKYKSGDVTTTTATETATATETIAVTEKTAAIVTTAAIELKFFKKENHREPHNRYDVFRDIANLEQYKESGIDICYFILATDHTHYYNQANYSPETADFDFRTGKRYKAATILQYKTGNKKDITLRHDYDFEWEKINEFYFLKLKV